MNYKCGLNLLIVEQTKLLSVIFSCCCCFVVVVVGGGDGGGLPKDLIQYREVVCTEFQMGVGGEGDYCNYISRKMSVFITKVLTPTV